MFTRAPADYPTDRRRPFTIILVVGAVLYLALTALGTLWTDFLWFDSIGYAGVWQRKWGMSIFLGVVGIAVAFILLWVNLRIADRLSPRWAPFDLSEEEELIERFREWIEPRARQVRLWVTGFLALLLGLAVASWREDVFLFLNTQSFAVNDPIFGQDVGFYVFELPLWTDIADWVFNALVLTTVVVVVSHYFNGGIRFNGRRFTVARGPKIHISVLLALIALVRAAVYRLDMYELLFSDRNSFFGPGFTDVTARLPAYRLLILVAVVAAVLFIVNIFRQGWILAGVAVGSWVVVALAAAVIYPLIVQRFQVAPDPQDKEAEYLENNLTLTRRAWGFDAVDVRPFAAADDLTAEDIEANQQTMENLRIWTPSVLPTTYQNFQELRPYYNLGVVDTDRYLDEGTPRQVMLAVRELEGAPEGRDDWENQRLIYTHGVGAVANAAAVVQEDGQPQFLLQDVPPVASVDQLQLDQPRVYFGETYDPGEPVIVDTGDEPQEIDFPDQGQEGTAYNSYDGAAGVRLSSIWERIAFAFRYRDLNLLISGEIRPESKVLVERNIRQIVANLAPFLHADTDPYPVIMDGRILWVLDLYTASTHYPYSQPITRSAVGRLAESSSLQPGINYMRNSVKAVIDAYDGDVTFYLNDPTDPLAQAWDQVYPGMLKPASEMPDGLAEHLRYPQDMFRVQGELYREYHVTDFSELFSGNDAWSLPADPSTISRGSAGSELLQGDALPAQGGLPAYRDEILPYYLLTTVPGETDLSYLLLQPFTPRDKKNMASFLVADSTPGRYGRLIDFRMPQGELVDGTEQVGQRIEQDPTISEQFTLWDNQGSRVIKGDMLVVPIETSVVYVQPIFLEAEGGGFPEFQRVIVVYGDQVEWSSTLEGALDLVFGDGTGEPSEPQPTPGGSTAEELLDQAADAFANADTALRDGDLSEYQRWVDEAQRLMEEARNAIAGAVEAMAHLFG
jgi:uncharacterized protein